MELWKDVEGFGDMYQVSNKGRVKSLDRAVKQRNGSVQIKRGRVMSQTKNHKGYPLISFSKDNKRYSRAVHRLVAIAFVENPEGKPQVNHIDGDKTNNNSDNLEWVTASENVVHALESGLMTPCIKNAKRASNIAREVNKKRVSQYGLDGLYIETFESLIEAERKTNVSRKRISEAVRGRQKTAGGYVWKYAK